ncbi:hypothetical protein BGZ68_000908 [Mortierella alpina]|nr:hypothetical protein BGZ68_000908 [Mortierella alpina]
MEYHEEITNAVMIFLQGQTRYTNQRFRSNAEAEGICRLIYNSTRSVFERIFGFTGKARGTKSVRNEANHVVEYFSYLPVVAAAHALADIASESPFWWFANQIATLVLVTDAITEYNGQVCSTPYGVIAQALLADALNRLKVQNDVFKTVTSFALTERQGLPSVVKPGFWSLDSDLEHRSDDIAGIEQNASMGLFRKLFLDLIRVLNDYKAHFKPLALRTFNSVLLGGSSGDFDFDIGFSLSDLRAAGMIIYSDGCNNYVLDPHELSENDLKVYRLHKITQDKFITDDEPVQHMRPALIEIAAS